MWVEQSISYDMNEKEFILYFDRCREKIGLSFDEIEKILHQLQRYHNEMVKEEFPFRRRTLKELFDDWKKVNTSPWI